MSDMRAKYALLGVMVFIVGFVSAMYLTPSVSAMYLTPSLTSTEAIASTSFLLGHIEVTVFDANGNLKHYQQTDNIVTDSGNECALRNLFGTVTITNGPAECSDPNTTDTFRNIALGDSGVAATFAQDDIQGTQHGVTAADTIEWDVPTQKITMELECIIPECGVVADDVVAETAIYDGLTGKTSTDNMLARQALNSITVSAGDTLNITWTIDTDNL